MRLKDKVAITTGAASGIGKATAILFAEHGAKVVVADIDEDGANQTVSTIRDAGNEAISVQTDVTTSANTERTVQHTLNTYGKLDILLSSAGIAMRLPSAICQRRLEPLSKCESHGGLSLCQGGNSRNAEKRWGLHYQPILYLRTCRCGRSGSVCRFQRRRDEPHPRDGTSTTPRTTFA